MGFKAFLAERIRNKKRRAGDDNEEAFDVGENVGGPKRRNVDTRSRSSVEFSHVDVSDNGVDLLARDALHDNPIPFIYDESDVIPYGRENPSTRSVMEENVRVIDVELEHELIQKINIARYYVCPYTNHSTARVYFVDSEEGRMACEVKREYLKLKTFRGPKALKSGFSDPPTCTIRMQFLGCSTFGPCGVALGFTTKYHQPRGVEITRRFLFV